MEQNKTKLTYLSSEDQSAHGNRNEKIYVRNKYERLISDSQVHMNYEHKHYIGERDGLVVEHREVLCLILIRGTISCL